MPVAEGIEQLQWSWLSTPHKLSDISVFDRASRGLFLFLVKHITRIKKSNVTNDVSGQGGFGSVHDEAWLLDLFATGEGSLKSANDILGGLASSMAAAMRNNPFGRDEWSSGWDKHGDLTVANGTSYAAMEYC
ncbi:hypothetical protein B0T10DRAFT_550445 [Thelonectria olida]|uniref:Uncharacterized protein n=1 Tax=Thelonectria olida TaxID=1576542 RepID=A0A9P8W0U9_9HYPO|nr:hypothetical protein B0T10DRAFT_550445 [Thelonectria olida]